MTDPYREPGEKRAEQKLEEAPTRIRRALLFVVDRPFETLYFMVLSMLIGLFAMTTRYYISPEYAAEQAAALARKTAAEKATADRDRICWDQGIRNALAWSVLMRLRDPHLSCRWYGANGCGNHVECSVGGEGSPVYGIMCDVGDGTVYDGQHQLCQLRNPR